MTIIIMQVKYKIQGQLATLNQTTHGQVNFNLGILNSYNFANSFQFQDLVGTVIHEITHVLGFSIYDIPRWVDSNKKPHFNPTTQYLMRGMKKKIILIMFNFI
ncbi:leishmanolysin family protein, putative (macronuclear) [Tetrahymena thermophila SB210]|uniref:Leishmanolysin family protein, putative n=1 Tax=Tetrahymena thermophila (strain SB210) TaxID=312017 RepID=I7M241_TETTS|nr:leishmanolysin family protein, putative [Tetrahymena thermophila SB210]EAR98434.1 leishmanolysin family protein, putative [Tetrahymena thermophila SB210]|eukprot:XP_001018679.1 leishmanolysin family protein, putative [Tetrahymena thermophila SB210]